MPAHLVPHNHVNLTVSDLAASTEWYCRVFGLTKVTNHVNIGPPYFNDVTYDGLFDLRTSSYTIGLIQHPDPIEGRFDARRVGLDHVGFTVANRADLEDWVARLDAEGIEHSGIVEAPYALAVSFKDPDGIALELFVPDYEWWTNIVVETVAT